GEATRDEAMHIGAIERIVSGRHRVAQEGEELVPELKLCIVVQPAHHAHAEPLVSEPRVDWATRAADAELILRDELRRRAEVDPQGVLPDGERSEEHTSELQSRVDLVCRLLLEKKNISTN